MAKVNKLDIKEGKFTPETVYDNDHYYTDENGHIRPKPEYKKLKNPDMKLQTRWYNFETTNTSGEKITICVDERDLTPEQKELIFQQRLKDFQEMSDELNRRLETSYLKNIHGNLK